MSAARDDGDPPGGRRRSPWLAVGGVAAVGVVAALLLVGAKLSIDEAEQETGRCLKAIDETGEGDPAECRQSGAMLTIVRTLPSVDGKGRAELAEVEARVLQAEMRVASVRDLDASARDAAADALLALRRGEPEMLAYRSTTVLWEAGALEVLAEWGSAVETDFMATRAALILGDWDAALQIARQPTREYSDGKSAAIIACLAGDRDTAVARIREAEANAGGFGFKLADLRMIEIHCELPPRSLAESSRLELREVAGYYADERIAETGAYLPAAWLQKLAHTAKTETEADAIVSLLFNTAHADPDVPMQTQYDLRGAGGWVIVTDLEAGARRLLELGSQDGDARVLANGFWLASTAAAERLWRGELAEAAADHALIREFLAREELAELRLALEVAILGLLAHLDPERALAVTHEALAVAEPSFMQALCMALILERAGELDAAIATAKLAWDRIPETGAELELGARSIYSMLLLEAGRAGELGSPVPADLNVGVSTQEVIAYWLASAQVDPAAQVGLRWRSGGVAKLHDAGGWFAPVTLDLIARSAPADRRELWLDVMSADLSLDPLSVVRTRRAAAERLGDTAGVERWREREAALLERIRGDRAVGLYRLLF